MTSPESAVCGFCVDGWIAAAPTMHNSMVGVRVKCWKCSGTGRAPAKADASGLVFVDGVVRRTDAAPAVEGRKAEPIFLKGVAEYLRRAGKPSMAEIVEDAAKALAPLMRPDGSVDMTEFEAERDALRAERDELRAKAAHYELEARRLNQLLDMQRRALRHFGRHERDCEVDRKRQYTLALPQTCGCGLDAALSATT